MRRGITTFSFILFILCNIYAASQPNKIGNRNIDDIIRQLTLEQKACLLVGCAGNDNGCSHNVVGAAGFTYAIDALGIPSINLADGPVGVRINPLPAKKNYTAYATCFPSSTALAATWNKELSLIEGKAIGLEARAYGVDIMLTPGINIMRNPLCGRNFEYMSEDPVLAGFMASAMTNGIQSKGIGTSLKHFVANNQQVGKLYNDARISQRALRELYLKGFEICVKQSNPWTVMSSYNKIGGMFTQVNPELLKTLLRKEWGYDGIVVSDWYKTRETLGQINGGTVLLMPGEKLQIDEIIAGVKEGKISESILNEAVKQVLQLVAKSISAKGWSYTAPDLKAHATKAREIASESMVLLKNDSSVLPLAHKTKIALFGATAYKSIAGGTGSSNVNKPYIIDIYKGLEQAGYSLNSQLKSVYSKYVELENELTKKHATSTEWELLSYNRTVIPEMNLTHADAMIQREAKNSEMAVVVLGRGSGEEADRRENNDFNLTAVEQDMIEKVSTTFHAMGKKVVIVMNVGGVMETKSWKDKVDAIVLAWFPGQECGDAVADIISGKVNPSGRLPMTFPVSYSSIPSSKNYPTMGTTKSGKNFDYTNYEEDIWVGYRYFNTAHKEVCYPFGYGMSYTDFQLSDAKMVANGNKWVCSVKVTNVGKQSGKEVVQLYVSAPDNNMKKPESELKSFAKTKNLAVGESEILTFTFNNYDIASFDENNSQWLTAPGCYTLLLGTSSRDIKIKLPFTVKKAATWKVNDILRPVEKVNVMSID